MVPKISECCDSTGFSKDTHVCCDNQVVIQKSDPAHDSCCPISIGANQGASYRRDTSKCIGGQVKPIDTDSAICGFTPYNSRNDLCCNNALHVNAKGQGKECCNPGTDIFRPDTEDCCDGEVKPRTTTGR